MTYVVDIDMVKYYNKMVVFEEIPNEITLAINITNCPCHCKGCHSPFLWKDDGIPLTEEKLDDLIISDKGITCVAFMGGDASPSVISQLAAFIKGKYELKVGWYSGRDELSHDIDISFFDYIKIGRYDENLGGLNNPMTNQRLYQVKKRDDKFELQDITDAFWNKKR